jgi:hypothetical protein
MIKPPAFLLQPQVALTTAHRVAVARDASFARFLLRQIRSGLRFARSDFRDSPGTVSCSLSLSKSTARSREGGRKQKRLRQPAGFAINFFSIVQY